LLPGIAVGAGVAFTVGEKLLGPPTVAFSVGDGVATLVLVGVVVVVVVLVGASFSLLLHAVERPITPAVSAMAATTDRGRILFIYGSSRMRPSPHRPGRSGY
jgi:hypothetical protein